MEEDKKPPINEDLIMSIVSNTQSEKGKAQVTDNEEEVQLRQNPDTEQTEKTVEAHKTQINADETKIAQKQETRKRKNRQTPVDYEGMFIKKADLTVRSGKGVYIRSDYHGSINRIISVVGNNEISITDYLDNILAHHFECFEQDINDVFERNYKPIRAKKN